jgi:hypothetical protein
VDESESREIDRIALYWHPVAIGRDAFVFWDRADPEKQMQFLKSIDSSYFEYVARINEPLLEGGDAMHAAVALRIAYSHAMESLFALMGAALQAPDYPVGWMLKYKLSDLLPLLSDITNRKPVFCRHRLRPPTWEGVAKILFPLSDEIDGVQEARSAFARLWRNLAKEFTEERFQNEYNSLKHGFRVSSGPWYAAIGLETTPGVPAPRENMRLMGESDFGSTYFTPLYIKKHQQFYLGEQRNNWSPHLFAKRLPLIAASIRNIIVFLHVWFGDRSDDLGFEVVTSEMIDAAWDDPNPLRARYFDFKLRIREFDIPAVSKEDILATYNEEAEDPPKLDESEASS